jgi:hypothetical protein
MSMLTLEHWSVYFEQCFSSSERRSPRLTGDKREIWEMKILLLVAAAVGLGAILAGNVLPDVTRYLRIRRM